MTWWFQGVITLGFGFVCTLVMLGATLRTASAYRSIFIKVYAVLAAVYALGVVGAVIFIYLAETGRI